MEENESPVKLWKPEMYEWYLNYKITADKVEVVYKHQAPFKPQVHTYGQSIRVSPLLAAGHLRVDPQALQFQVSPWQLAAVQMPQRPASKAHKA